MLRKASASVFLVVMSLLIVLRAPVFGYCPDSEVFFIGDFECHFFHGHHDHGEDLHHEGEHDHDPCDENHRMISLESDDFFWTGMADPEDAKVLETGDLVQVATVVIGQSKRPLNVISPSRAPPPPDDPVYLRFSVMRL